ncbi:MAG: beta-galactosidase small subunit, partial [Porticoccaceae bacterium]|nr:beta-galactosidase small subunit [Porticoccaceae bacterium]
SAEYLLNIRFTGKATPLLGEDHTHAAAQLLVQAAAPAVTSVPEPDQPPSFNLVQTDKQFLVTSGSVGYAFDVDTGELNGIEMDDQQLLKSPLTLNFWRPTTDNDFGAQLHDRLGIWRELSLNMPRPTATNISRESGFSITSHYKLDKVGGLVDLIYTVSPDGVLSVTFSAYILNQNLPEIPRLGINLALSDSLSELAWYGRGPHENYIDRKTSADIGVYHSTVNEQLHPYIRAQESGHKTDTRWLSLRNQKNGLLFSAKPIFGFSALPVHWTTINALKPYSHNHSADLVKGGATYLNIDFWHMGVGGVNSWFTPPQPQYMRKAANSRASFTITPVVTGN